MKQNLYLKGFSHGFGRVPKASADLLSKSIQKLRDSVGCGLYRVFEEVLPAESILRRCGERRRLYDSATTLFGMVSQAYRSSSLREAVRELQAVDRLMGRKVRSGNTGSYAEARGRLDEQTVEQAHEQVVGRIGAMAERNARGGRVLAVDATGVQLDDTESNLRYYRYAACQKRGCGFPVMQQVALMDLGSGCILDAVATAHTEGESPLFEAGLSDFLEDGDLLLADRAYCSFLNFVRVIEAGADAVMRLNSSRDMRAIKRSDDAVVTWRRPDFSASPHHLFREHWEALPEEGIEIRLVRYRVERRGFRSREILLATTLMEASIEELAQLYHRRWEIETEFRHIKTTMGMDHMRVKSPDMAHKQMYAFFIAHNLLRWIMLKAARESDVDPTRLSFKGALDSVVRWTAEMAHLPRKPFRKMMDQLLLVIARDCVPIRPDRIEPRRIKKRLKRFTLLTFPRREYLPDDEFFKSGLS